MSRRRLAPARPPPPPPPLTPAHARSRPPRSYKQLKKLLKRCPIDPEPAAAAAPPTPPDEVEADSVAGAAAAAAPPPGASPPLLAVDAAAEAAFFAELRRQLSAANAHFHREATAAVSAARRAARPRGCCAPLRRPGPRALAARAERAYWCRKYARANAVALRKILKKHDKVCGNAGGRRFLQECWRSAPAGSALAEAGLFLHSPLLDELKAVQDVLQRRAAEAAGGGDEDERAAPAGTPAEAAAPAARPARGGEAADAAAAPAAPALADAASGFGSAVGSAGGGGGGAATPSATDSEGRGTLPTASSLRAQRAAGLAAVLEDPGCMLDSSDEEWAAGGGGGDPDAPAPAPPLGPAPAEAPRAASGGGASSGLGPAGGPFVDEDLRCPICLDLMYRPVGLACGHKFCRACALEAAGFGRLLGAFRNVVSYVPRRTPCPHCRQPDVYRTAIALKEVGALIRARHPEEWAARAGEERARARAWQERAAAAAAAAAAAPGARASRSPFDLLLGPAVSPLGPP